MKQFAWLLSIGALAIAACTIDDEDRCPEGFYWDGALKACLEEEEVEDAGECVRCDRTEHLQGRVVLDIR